MERDRTEATGGAAVAAVGEPEESGVAGAVGSTGSVDWRAGRCGGRTGQHPTSSAAINDASGSRADHRAGVRANHGTGATLSPRQTGGQLSRADSHGAFQRRSWAAAGTHQQAGESVFARVAGGSSAKCGAAWTGDASRGSTIGPAAVACAGQVGHGARAGGHVVLGD